MKTACMHHKEACYVQRREDKASGILPRAGDEGVKRPREPRDAGQAPTYPAF
jgi:hypothetical protein